MSSQHSPKHISHRASCLCIQQMFQFIWIYITFSSTNFTLHRWWCQKKKPTLRGNVKAEKKCERRTSPKNRKVKKNSSHLFMICHQMEVMRISSVEHFISHLIRTYSSLSTQQCSDYDFCQVNGISSTSVIPRTTRSAEEKRFWQSARLQRTFQCYFEQQKHKYVKRLIFFLDMFKNCWLRSMSTITPPFNPVHIYFNV